MEPRLNTGLIHVEALGRVRRGDVPGVFQAHGWASGEAGRNGIGDAEVEYSTR
jgi:hypothetical protein